jgi:hypothetical protein
VPHWVRSMRHDATQPCRSTFSFAGYSSYASAWRFR